MVVLILGLAFILIDGMAGKPEAFNGIVVDKHYEAEQNSTGTGYGMTSSGESGVIVTSTYEGEKFLIMVKTETGKIVTVECVPEVYYQKEIGQKIDCVVYKGFFTGWAWSMRGVL